MNGRELLSVFDIKASFGGIPVLKGVDFSLIEGEIHGLIGKNGAGKSTLMKVFSGVYQPDHGRIEVLGNLIPSPNVEVMKQNGIVMVYQDLSLVETLTVAQNIFLGHDLYRKYGLIDSRREHQEARKLLLSLGVESIKVESLVREISPGEKQLVEIAKALSVNPRILILDEPTASLANFEIEQLFKVIGVLKNRGISMIYITHYLEDILKICDRVTVLRDGERVDTLSVKKTSVERMVSAMLGIEEKLESKNWLKKAVKRSDVRPLLKMDRVSTSSIEEVSLVVYPGEIVGLAGLLGSGRTEIVEALYGLENVHSGKIFLDDREVKIDSPHHAVAHKISLLPEERRDQGLILDFSIQHNLIFTILERLVRFFLISDRSEKEIADTYIKKLDISTTGREQKVRYLSGGNQQKVVMGKCLASSPRLLLLDDPTFGIDIKSKIEIMKRIKHYTDLGHGAIFISSEFKEIVDFCDRTYVIKKGRISHDFNNTDLSCEQELLQAVQ